MEMIQLICPQCELPLAYIPVASTTKSIYTEDIHTAAISPEAALVAHEHIARHDQATPLHDHA